MSRGRLFIGNLDFTADEEDLRNAFAPYGAITSVSVAVDRETGKPRGFGFVEYTSSGDAESAIEALDGKELCGRNLRVSAARERESNGYSSTQNGGSRGRRTVR